MEFDGVGDKMVTNGGGGGESSLGKIKKYENKQKVLLQT